MIRFPGWFYKGWFFRLSCIVYWRLLSFLPGCKV